MNIGEPQKEIIVEPIPIPEQEPVPEKEKEPAKVD